VTTVKFAEQLEEPQEATRLKPESRSDIYLLVLLQFHISCIVSF